MMGELSDLSPNKNRPSKTQKSRGLEITEIFRKLRRMMLRQRSSACPFFKHRPIKNHLASKLDISPEPVDSKV